ncbi:TIGR03643 family protein [uncultured Microscilla sp.]|uniref:TIGR03643 family protein n=1 Tax=uncultured Microscilla sp. TaxID=432653 RepID=UPI0026376BCF|nr:TIGR03643 family protein [uncultured Microscilla sp.]
MNILKQKLKNLDNESIDRIIEMAWEDRTPFEAIGQQFELTEQEVIRLMRKEMKPRSWKMWRKRVQGRKTKHKKLRAHDVNRFHCSRQKSISQNKIAKRNH